MLGCNNYKQVSIDSTAGGAAVLTTATTRVPVLNRLEVSSTNSGALLQIRSITAGSTAELVGTMKLPLSWPFEAVAEACLRGRRYGSLELLSTGPLDGFALVSFTTQPAT